MKSLEDWTFLKVSQVHESPAGLGVTPISLYTDRLSSNEVHSSSLPDAQRKTKQELTKLGRALLLLGNKAPRYQALGMGKSIHTLLDQIENLAASDPALRALKKDLFIKLRTRLSRL
jgi:hypothetical protein